MHQKFPMGEIDDPHHVEIIASPALISARLAIA
jgi:hypothetical protein